MGIAGFFSLPQKRRSSGGSHLLPFIGRWTLSIRPLPHPERVSRWTPTGADVRRRSRKSHAFGVWARRWRCVRKSIHPSCDLVRPCGGLDSLRFVHDQNEGQRTHVPGTGRPALAVGQPAMAGARTLIHRASFPFFSSARSWNLSLWSPRFCGPFVSHMVFVRDVDEVTSKGRADGRPLVAGLRKSRAWIGTTRSWRGV